jgi:putative endonuclease
MNEQFYVYIMTNRNNTVLYTGITSDLKKRTYEHKHKLIKGFTTRYNIDKLVYFEIFSDSYNAISREKQIKSGSRKKKILLIESVNPDWKDLSDQI